MLRQRHRVGNPAASRTANATRPALEGLEERVVPSSSAFVRLNQVGYEPGATKTAFLLASSLETGATFQVLDSGGHTVYSAPVGANLGTWSTSYPDVYALDFSAVTTPGSYSVTATGPIPAGSPSFRIDTAANLYAGLLPKALFFYQAQQDGPDVNSSVLDRQPSHLTDESAKVYSTPVYMHGKLQGTLNPVGGPVDVSGGWFDAGDYIKLVETASYTEAVMLLAVRDYPGQLSGGSADFATEARFGMDWLLKMWHDGTQTLYYQVGIGDGNGTTILGDHDVWRLPQADDALNVKPGDPEYYIKYRPVFEAGSAGSLISPNLAGRLAADFALGFQVFQASDPAYADRCLLAGEHVFDLARTTNVGQLLTAAPHGYYPEVEWRDDLELGATELYFAVASGNLPSGLPHTAPLFYLKAGAQWASAYINGPHDGGDSLNLYDVSGLAHYELSHAIAQAGNPSGLAVTPAQLLADLKKQLDIGVAQARRDPFGFGTGYGSGNDLTPHALGYALEASFYDELANASTYADFGQTQLSWVLGANAWGATFIVGAGTTFPEDLQHQVANLVGSLDGGSPILLGATVDGPNQTSVFKNLGLPSGARTNPPDEPDEFKAFTGHGARYWDNVKAYPSTEPADDYTALTILLFAREVAGAPPHAALAGPVGTLAQPRVLPATVTVVSADQPAPAALLQAVTIELTPTPSAGPAPAPSDVRHPHRPAGASDLLVFEPEPGATPDLATLVLGGPDTQ
jgi:hypothetical protein